VIEKRTKYQTPNVDQIVYYQAGVGTSPNLAAHLTGGLIGQGVPENVRDAYTYICLNYQGPMHGQDEPDEIYLFGFSRGAYTARAICGLICQFGLLTQHHLNKFKEVYDHYIAHNFSITDQYKAHFMEKYPGSRYPDIKIKFIGVWETVGSLGVPDLYLFGWRPAILNSMLHWMSAPHNFGDTDLLPNVEFAYQA
jgi:uncharacterized protein (DUF2235 family)